MPTAAEIARLELEGQIAVVTGAARGLGLAIARTLARAGADVALVDVLPLDDAVAAVRAESREAWPLQVDLSDRASVRSAVRSFADRQPRLDILVNNAGIQSGTPLEELTDEEFDRVMLVNAAAMLATVQAAWPKMLTQRSGRIVLMGSRTAQASSIAGPAYTASKGAVHSLVISIASAGGPHGILCNGVAPAAIATENARAFVAERIGSSGQEEGWSTTLPLGHTGSPDDVARAVLFLASPANTYINGSILKVNGGMLMG